MIDSKQFYQYLQETFAQAREQIADDGAPEANIFIFSNAPWGKDKPELKIKIDAKIETGLQVDGRDLQDVVDEYCRRFRFQTRQKLAMLEAPKEEIILQPPTPPVSDPMDDEIPF